MRIDAVILNPFANGGAGARRWRGVIQSRRAKELGLDQAEIFDGRDVRPWLESKIRQGARRFVVAGGDGTVHSVLNTYLDLKNRGSDIPKDLVFGAIGIGSSNDFHKPYLTSGREKIAGCPTRLEFDSAFAHDAGILKLEANPYPIQFFINCSVGVTAEANYRFNTGGSAFQALKRKWVNGAIVSAALSTFATYQNQQISMQIDSDPETQLNLTNLGVIKNKHFAGTFRYDQGPQANDGELGVHVCADMNRVEMLSTLGALAQGKFSGRQKTQSQKAKKVLIRSLTSRPLVIETDGETQPAHFCEIGILNQEIILCP